MKIQPPRTAFWVVAAMLLCTFVAAGQTLEELRTAAQVRGLTAEQAARHYPARLRGVVTVFDQGLFARFMQDDTAGIYLMDAPVYPPLISGQMVEVEGETSPGEYAPVVVPRRVQVV